MQLPGCFPGVTDLGATDIQRGRDHGVPTYKSCAGPWGCSPQRVHPITGESTDRIPRQARIRSSTTRQSWISPRCMTLGRPVPPATNGRARAVGDPAHTLAARLKAIYGTVDTVDAFVGMVCRATRSLGMEFGELQLALWGSGSSRRCAPVTASATLSDPGLRRHPQADTASPTDTGLAELITRDAGVPASVAAAQRVLRAHSARGASSQYRPVRAYPLAGGSIKGQRSHTERGAAA